MPTESRVHARSLVAFAARRPEVVVLSGDLTSSTEADDFKATYPERFLSAGMAEQNMMSVAGGLARQGLRPFVHTFAVFMYRRALDQIEMSIAYPDLPVVMVGFLPGITTPGGVSHQAINDVAVLRSVPNMRVLECGDAADVESVLDVAFAQDGPVYVRMIRGAVPRLFTTPMEFGRARVLTEGDDVLVLSTGICTEAAIGAVTALRDQGTDVGHLHVSTLKPFDDPVVVEHLRRARRVVTVENHSVVGGLGSAVAEVLAEHGLARPLTRLGLQDTYAHGASKDYLMRSYGIDGEAIVRAVGADVALDAVRRTASVGGGAAPVTEDEAL